MTTLEAVGSLVAVLIGGAVLFGLFTRLVAMPYLQDNLIDPVLERLDKLAAKDTELETSYRAAASMFEGHMAHSERDRGRLWDAIDDLRKDRHHHG